jgi:sulfatase maturation enzyme AslB (radical SAM superfamily)
MTQQPLVVVWRVYEPCNLGCQFCGYSREISRKRHIVSSDVILKFGAVLLEYRQRTGKEVLVSWLGGEPLLWKELPVISQTYHQEFGITLGVTTNGTMLDREHVRRSLIDHYSLVTISIDGFANFHDMQRREIGLFEKLKRNVGLLVEEISASNSMLRLRVNSILMRKNIHAFEAFCVEMAGWGIQELTFNQLGGIDRPEFYPDNHLLPEQAAWLVRELPTIQTNALLTGLKVFGTKQYLERISATSLNTAIPIVDCSPGKHFLFIDEENRVSPCNFTTESYGMPLSQIEDVDALVSVAECFRYKQSYERASPCNNCMSTQVFEKFN